MKKLLQFYDNHILKIGIAFLLIFTALYPKLPSVHIIRTWVYIRLEDFFILAVVVIWLIQVMRGKARIVWAPSLPIVFYWIAGLVSLVFSLIFIAPTLTNFFPHIAILNYLRRIEYMILFLVAISSVKNLKDIYMYLKVLIVTSGVIVLYGLGQRYYLNLWSAFPDFFEKYSFCFPSFQTGNEEFAKGIPLCLEAGARLTSTFGGHYDLAGYLVLVLPIILLTTLSVKKWRWKIFMAILYLGNLVLLIFTSSRVSFISYIAAVCAALIFYKKKLFIIPVLVVSFLLLVIFSGSTGKRLLATARVSSVVTDMQGQLVGEAPGNLSQELKDKISKNQEVVQKPPPVQNLPLGSGYIGLPQNSSPKTTDIAVIQKTLSPEEIKRLNIQSGSLLLSTVTGNFVIRKVLVYDISFTTRFQGEWPNAWRAFLRNPYLGSGYSAITLATDNDYLRAMGETGLAGFLTFVFIFLVFGIIFKSASPSVDRPLVKSLVFGVAGGVIGLMINATLIDIFEASKVAETLWILLGIGIGALLLSNKTSIPYLQILKKVFSANFFLAIYLLTAVFVFYLGSITNFFVDSDFSVLRLAASSSIDDVAKYFIDSQNILYVPLAKIAIFFLYSFFRFSPEGYHVFILILHFFAALGVYFLAEKLFKNRIKAFLAGLIFLLFPTGANYIYWLSNLPIMLASVFVIFSLVSFYKFRTSKSVMGYCASIVFYILAMLSSVIGIIVPLIFLMSDIFRSSQKAGFKNLLVYLPFVILFFGYVLVLNLTGAVIAFPFSDLVYLAGGAVSILIVAGINLLSKKINDKNRFYKEVFVVFALLIIAFICNLQVQRSAGEWGRAGTITKNVVTDLKVSYEIIPKKSAMYFVDVPEKVESVPVFSTGLIDGLWFMYQKDIPEVHESDSIDAARQEAGIKKGRKNYIFIVQKDGRLKEIK